MEKLNAMEQKRLKDELIQGRELANKLKQHLDPTTSNDTREKLIRKLLSSYDKAISVLSRTSQLPECSLMESPQSFHGISPKREGGYSDSKGPFRKNVFKKRKISGSWSKQVRVCLRTGTGIEGPPDDGYSWRKYGQKEILGATHPRAYYRCTHRPTKGCNATKQVQKTDEDSSILEITYKGKHTCIHTSQSDSNLPTTIALFENAKVYEEKQEQNHDLLFQFQENLRVKAEGLGSSKSHASFSFLSTPNESEPLKENIFSESNSPTSFISNETSDPSLFWENIDSDLDLDLTDIISTTNSPFQEFDFLIDQPHFDSNFTLGEFEYFA